MVGIMGSLPPQQRRRAQTRQEIIDTAHRIVVEQGQASLTIRSLAERIDYTPGALYKYFASKEALIDAVREACFERLNGFIVSRLKPAGSAPDMLLTGGMAYIEYAQQHPQEYHLMFNMEPSAATSGDQRTIAMHTLLQIVQIGLDRGEIVPRADYDANAITYHCWATVHGIASLHTTIRLSERDDLLAISHTILQQVIAGFTA